MQLLALFAVGALVGWTGRALVQRGGAGDAALSVFLGIAGALIAAAVGGVAGFYTRPDEGLAVFTAMVGAMAFLWLCSPKRPAQRV